MTTDTTAAPVTEAEAEVETMCARLERTERAAGIAGYDGYEGPVNPDGFAAADLIRRLVADRDEARREISEDDGALRVWRRRATAAEAERDALRALLERAGKVIVPVREMADNILAEAPADAEVYVYLPFAPYRLAPSMNLNCLRAIQGVHAEITAKLAEGRT